MALVGMVGLGAMGSGLLYRLRLADVDVVGYDIAPGARQAAQEAGARIAESPVDVARAATTIDVVVRTDEETLECTLGPDGLIKAAEPGALVILHGTILPQTTKRIAEAGQARKLDVIDACMLGIPDVVRRGEMRFVVGGTDEQFERARPHLLRMGREVVHMGPLGAGNVAKLVHNLLQGSQTLVLHEAVQLGQAGGIPYPQMLEWLHDMHTGGSLLDRWQRTFDPSGADPTPNIGHNTIGKDVPLAAEFARQAGVDLPIIEQLGAAGLRLDEAARAGAH